jgi:hypothetical protein
MYEGKGKGKYDRILWAELKELHFTHIGGGYRTIVIIDLLSI